MPRTIDTIMAAHHAATARRNAGKPIWAITVRFTGLFHNPELTFEQFRDAVVARIKASRWDKITEDAHELERLIIDLGTAADVKEFDEYWDELYDLSGTDRVWIITR